MLAAAITDLDGVTAEAGEKRGQIERPELNFQPGQLLAEQPVLALVQALARSPSEEGTRLARDGQRWRLGQLRPPSPRL
jgi:hypothetical protein